MKYDKPISIAQISVKMQEKNTFFSKNNEITAGIAQIVRYQAIIPEEYVLLWDIQYVVSAYFMLFKSC